MALGGSAVLHLQMELTELSTSAGESAVLHLQMELSETTTALGGSPVLQLESETLISPAQTYSGSTPGVADHGPTRHFGAPISGSVAFTGVPPAGHLVGIAVAPSVVSLTWTDVSDLEQGYRVERSPNGQGDWTEIASLPADTEIYIDYTATPGIVWDYRVISFNDAEDGPPSNIVHVSTPFGPTAPAPQPDELNVNPDVLEFKSPGVYGLERDDTGGDTGFRF